MQEPRPSLEIVAIGEFRNFRLNPTISSRRRVRTRRRTFRAIDRPVGLIYVMVARPKIEEKNSGSATIEEQTPENRRNVTFIVL